MTRAIMAGQVKHVQLFSGAMPDVRMVKMLWKLPRRNTVALIGGVAAEMAKEGIELIDSTYFVQDHLAPAGPITKRKPSDQELANIKYGLDIAAEYIAAQFRRAGLQPGKFHVKLGPVQHKVRPHNLNTACRNRNPRRRIETQRSGRVAPRRPGAGGWGGG